MNRCQCFNTNGQQCVRKPSQNPNHNHIFCWQHQECKNPINKSQLSTPKQSAREKHLPWVWKDPAPPKQSTNENKMPWVWKDPASPKRSANENKMPWVWK